MKTIFIVEDEESSANLAKIILEQEGYGVIIASTGQEAIDSLKGFQELPNLILLDILLPKVNGIEVCKWIRSQPRFENIPIVIFTALVQEEDRIEGLKAGANEYITKPFSIDKLLDIIKEYIK
ncbi:MAG: response regulator [Candidatus Heimdallarchaeota archaeon]|nr:response regulator [Candidatus Heimdallarchaeota archaeon]